MNKSYVQEKLRFLVLMTNRLYEIYKDEPILVNAMRIEVVNRKIVDLLYNDGHFFGVENRTLVFGIIDHFQVWLLQFYDHRKVVVKAGDTFIYERWAQAVAYPQKEIEKILKGE